MHGASFSNTSFVLKKLHLYCSSSYTIESVVCVCVVISISYLHLHAYLVADDLYNNNCGKLLGCTQLASTVCTFVGFNVQGIHGSSVSGKSFTCKH